MWWRIDQQQIYLGNAWRHHDRFFFVNIVFVANYCSMTIINMCLYVLVISWMHFIMNILRKILFIEDYGFCTCTRRRKFFLTQSTFKNLTNALNFFSIHSYMYLSEYVCFDLIFELIICYMVVDKAKMYFLFLPWLQ